ncbi:MAG: oligosaccharide flippase family protein [Candidatus Shapirobacteria bacterium]|nr:oligosaccharide flippase family protein [Candidatus Shapirobacteria bacterium]
MGNVMVVAKNTFWQILGRVIMMICSLLTARFLTRFLGVETWGNYIFITNIVLMAFNLADFGTGTITVKKLAKAKIKTKQKQTILNQALTLKLIFTVIALIILAGLSFTLDQFQDIRILTLFSSLVIIFLTVRTLAEAFFMANLNFIAKVAFETTASLISIAGIIAISQIYQQISLGQALFVWGGSAVISAVAAIIFLEKKISFSFTPTKEGLKNFFNQSAPVGIRQLVFALYDAGIDSFFLKTLAGSAAVGFYGLSYKVYTNLILGAAFFMNSLFPIIINNHDGKDQSHLTSTIKRSGLFLLASGLVIGLLMVIGAPIIINFIGGQVFFPSIKVLRILSLALIFGYLNHLTGYTMIALGAQKQLLWLSVLALVINLAGNWLLIPSLGIAGAAWITVATEASILVTTGIFLINRLQSTPKEP